MVAEHAEQVEEQNAFLAKMVKEAAELKTECDLRENEFDHLVAQRKVLAQQRPRRNQPPEPQARTALAAAQPKRHNRLGWPSRQQR